MPGLDGQVCSRQAKQRGKKSNTGGISLSFHRRRFQSDFKGIAVIAGYTLTRGLWLYVNPQKDPVSGWLEKWGHFAGL